MVRHTLNIEASKGGAAGALELIILKAWIPRAQTIPMVVFFLYIKLKTYNAYYLITLPTKYFTLLLKQYHLERKFTSTKWQHKTMVVFSNLKKWSLWILALEPWNTALLPLGARSPFKYVLEIRSPRSFRGHQYLSTFALYKAL